MKFNTKYWSSSLSTFLRTSPSLPLAAPISSRLLFNKAMICLLMAVFFYKRKKSFFFHTLHIIQINTHLINDFFNFPHGNRAELAGFEIEQIKQSFCRAGNKEIKCTRHQRKIGKKLFAQRLKRKRTGVGFVCSCYLWRDRSECVDSFSGEIVILKRRPRADI